MDGPPGNDCCAICHGHFNIACQANCSHWFCGDCIMLVWHHGSVLQPCKCPLCRRQITLLVPGEASLRERNDPHVAEVLGKIERYNHLFGGNTSSLVQPDPHQKATAKTKDRTLVRSASKGNSRNKGQIMILVLECMLFFLPTLLRFIRLES